MADAKQILNSSGFTNIKFAGEYQDTDKVIAMMPIAGTKAYTTDAITLVAN